MRRPRARHAFSAAAASTISTGTVRALPPLTTPMLAVDAGCAAAASVRRCSSLVTAWPLND
jgi:hypothetical protein